MVRWPRHEPSNAIEIIFVAVVLKKRPIDWCTLILLNCKQCNKTGICLAVGRVLALLNENDLKKHTAHADNEMQRSSLPEKKNTNRSRRKKHIKVKMECISNLYIAVQIKSYRSNKIYNSNTFHFGTPRVIHDMYCVFFICCSFVLGSVGSASGNCWISTKWFCFVSASAHMPQKTLLIFHVTQNYRALAILPCTSTSIPSDSCRNVYAN